MELEQWERREEHEFAMVYHTRRVGARVAGGGGRLRTPASHSVMSSTALLVQVYRDALLLQRAWGVNQARGEGSVRDKWAHAVTSRVRPSSCRGK
ncbi:hypothetical protein DQ04_05521010 [Trypanosoma grayi]|uniref:hypothetical protein n=1 Tax=Trypanosoma grayi TaxID=71804 RepID=UPI0004F42AF3|nr:hypothetical protein DQ04_05521010 [Trypanosoma grayi]KEG09259.1 hypothetical protein DQ04_05521010 [Trypanosoma grayi]